MAAHVPALLDKQPAKEMFASDGSDTHCCQIITNDALLYSFAK